MNTPKETVKKIRVRDLVRAEFERVVNAGALGMEGEGTTTVRKHLLKFVVEAGGAKNSGPAEYNTVQHELIAAGFLVKLGRGKLVRAEGYVAPTSVTTADADPEPVADAATDPVPTDVMDWLLVNRETGDVEGYAESKSKAYKLKTPEQVVRKAETATA